jgi:hypothetical protein
VSVLLLYVRPVSTRVDGPTILGRLAGVYAQAGEIDRALDLLETTASLPVAINYGELKLNETWDPLRGHARFEAVVTALGKQSGAR